MKEALEVIRDWPVGEKQVWEMTARTMVMIARKALADAPPEAAASVQGPSDAAELLRKYKKLCIEISRGDSYHLARIDAAILSRATPAAGKLPREKLTDQRMYALIDAHSLDLLRLVREVEKAVREHAVWMGRHYPATPVVQGEPVAWALAFPGDARLNLSTVFDTEAEAKDYAGRCTGRPTVVPLYATPAPSPKEST